MKNNKDTNEVQHRLISDNDNKSENDREKFKSIKLIILIIAFLFFIRLGLYLNYYYNGTMDSIIHSIFRTLGFISPFLLLSSIISIFFIKSSFKKVFLKSLCTIVIPLFAITMIGETIYSSGNKNTAKRLINNIGKQYFDLKNTFVDNKKNQFDSHENYDIEKSNGTVFIDIEVFLKEYLESFSIMRNNYSLELQAIGWNSLLSAERINQNDSFVESKYIIERAKEIVNKYKTLTINKMIEGKEILNAINLPNGLKGTMRNEYTKGLTRGITSASAIYDLEYKIVLESEKILNFLKANKNQWFFYENNIYFKNDQDLSIYNIYQNNIKTFVQKEIDIQEKDDQWIQGYFEKLKKQIY